MSTRHRSTLYNGKTRMVQQRNRFARRLDERMIEEFLSRPLKREPQMIPVVHHATPLKADSHVSERGLIAREAKPDTMTKRDQTTSPVAAPGVRPVRLRRAAAPVKVYPRCIGYYRPRKKRPQFSFREMLAGLVVGGAAAVMGFALLRALILT
jgi:hypothetical protein